ncbi:SPOR domain-containing protein [Rhodobacter calidifons]|uniref:SPOR domain-containing protein n=1 Tax=Rhodobacter calidifons TaxID=2715277 RepID=A0ABX0G7Y9_9RHOB|nr:SPOR domain-containing protein [Rhodobacter calidifons]NHB76831.1 SPOR domain-containing protein [Rhodobacter calidifons]
MADADYDLGGGFPHDGAASSRSLLDPDRAARVQRIVNIGGALTSLALVVGLGIWGYRLAVRDVNGVPVIQAMEGPMRIAPADPGGAIADHQGLAVNELAETGAATPPPERLVLAPRPIDLLPEDAAGLAGMLQPGLTEASAPTGALPAGQDLALAAAPPTESADPTEIAIDAALAEALGEIPDAALYDPSVELALDLDAPEPAPAGAMVVSIRPKARPGARAAVAPAPVAALPAASEVDPATIRPGTRLVQFGTFDTAEEARAAWARLQGRFGEVMAGKSPVVQPAESGGRTFYRLRGHGFEGEDDARRFCSAFVAEGATCIPVPHK